MDRRPCPQRTMSRTVARSQIAIEPPTHAALAMCPHVLAGVRLRLHLGGIGGRRSTKVKSIAARANGLKGGRPRVKARGD